MSRTGRKSPSGLCRFLTKIAARFQWNELASEYHPGGHDAGLYLWWNPGGLDCGHDAAALGRSGHGGVEPLAASVPLSEAVLRGTHESGGDAC